MRHRTLNRRLGFALAPALAAGVSSCSTDNPVTADTGRTWHVQPDSTGDAPTIQAAMDSARAGDVVALARGTYTWSSQRPQGHSMVVVKPGVFLRGESPERTTLDAEKLGRVILCLSVGDVLIEGLTIQNGIGRGSSDGAPWVHGAGVYCDEESNPRISNCIIRNNEVPIAGGGIYCVNAEIADCQVVENIVFFEGFGAGIWSSGNLKVVGCVFRANSGFGDTGHVGGGIAAYRAVIADCLFEDNVARGFQGAQGGAISIGEGSIDNCTFTGNSARASNRSPSGGAVSVAGTVAISNCVLADNVASGNNSPGAGGAIGSTGRLPLMITGCTLVRNRATGQNPDPFGARPIGGIAAVNARVVSTIIAWSEGLAVNSTDSTSCCDFYGNSLGDSLRGIELGGNFTADPLFCLADSLSGRDFALRAASPCADGKHPEGYPCGRIGAFGTSCVPELSK